ncbi:MAG: hypothetical protein JXQ29_15610 [Planctomycetes bacterium]|nr:hypothetical protein [Planctomycetota bacterium]
MTLPRRIAALWLLAAGVWLAPRALEAVDPQLLDTTTHHPWILPRMFAVAAKVALVLAICGTAAVLLGRLRATQPSRRWPLAGLAALLLLPLGTRLVRSHSWKQRDILIHYVQTTGFDGVQLDRATHTLSARVGRAVRPRERVAVVSREDQDDWPHFLSFALCPRLFYAFKGQRPDDEELRAEGIQWVLDVRRTSYRSSYEEAVLERVDP